MKPKAKGLKWYSERSPLTIVEFIYSVSAIVGGFYYLGPFGAGTVAAANASALVQIFGNTIFLHTFGLVYFVVGIIGVTAIVMRNYEWRSRAIFGNILCRTFSLLSTWITVGFIPISWLTLLCSILVMIVCYWEIRKFLRTGRYHGN